jgi:hypothetical protein
MTTFNVIRDGADWIVADASVTAHSFAMIPKFHQAVFSRRYEAERQAEKLSGGNPIETRMVETPDRFEAVADTLYGPAWD